MCNQGQLGSWFYQFKNDKVVEKYTLYFQCKYDDDYSNYYKLHISRKKGFL